MRHLGRTGLVVSPLCLGGNVLGWTADEATSFDVLDANVAGGGNFIEQGIGRRRPARPGERLEVQRLIPASSA